MPLISINQTQFQQPRESTLDKILKGLDITNKVLGTALEYPKYRQQTKANELANLGTTVNILSNTEATPEGQRPDLMFENRGRTVIPSLSRKIQGLQEKNLEGDIAEQTRLRRALTPEEKQLNVDFLKRNGVPATIGDIPDTVGDWEKLKSAKLSAIQITPGQEREFQHKVVKETQAEEKEKQQRYIKAIDQYAETDSDAKEIKTAIANKNAIESFLDKMIVLREKHPKGTALDREDIARGQQIATQALLKYKNLAQLGVLSASDLELVNRLVPKDPLAITPVALGMGQDPIMAQLKQLREGISDDLNIFLDSKGLNPVTKPVLAPTIIDKNTIMNRIGD